MHEKLNVPFQFSFNLINYFFLFLFLGALPLLAKSIDEEKARTEYLYGFTLFSIPVIFAFYGSICSYDDFVQYFFLTVFLLFLFRHNRIVAIIFFSLACISRETSFIFLPFAIAYEWHCRGVSSTGLIVWGIPIALYASYLYLYLGPEVLAISGEYLQNNRFHAWQNNLQDFETVREAVTISSAMISLPLLLLFRKYKKGREDKKIRFLIVCASILIIENFALVWLSALVREARLFFIPLILAIPLFRTEIRWMVLSLWDKYFNKLTPPRASSVLLSAFITFIWYTPQTTGTGYIFKAYLFLFFILFFETLDFAIRPFLKKRDKETQPS